MHLTPTAPVMIHMTVSIELFGIVANEIVASEKAAWRSSDAGVQQCINEVRESCTRQLSTPRITKAEESKETRHKNRVLALQLFHRSPPWTV